LKKKKEKKTRNMPKGRRNRSRANAGRARMHQSGLQDPQDPGNHRMPQSFGAMTPEDVIAFLRLVGQGGKIAPTAEDLAGGKVSVHGFYKGTAFPCVKILPNMEAWSQLKAKYERCITDGVRGGFTLPKQIELYTEQNDRMEEFMCKWGVEHGEGFIKGDLITDALCREFGMPGDSPELCFSKIMELWYMNVYCLIRLKAVEDGEMYGWVIQEEANEEITMTDYDPLMTQGEL
jgi:hypothetical protein